MLALLLRRLCLVLSVVVVRVHVCPHPLHSHICCESVMLEIMFGYGLKFYNCNYSPDLVTGALSLSQKYNLENPIIFPVCCQIDIECFPQIENQILRIKESGS